MKEDERRLWERLRQGDSEAFEQLWKSHLGIVHFWVSQAMNVYPSANRDDLMEKGLTVLGITMQKFDSTKGKKFSAYLRAWLKIELFKYMQIRYGLSESDFRKIQAVRNAQDVLARKSGHQPTLAEIAQEARLKEKQVLEAFDLQAMTQAEDVHAPATEARATAYVTASPYHTVLVGELLSTLEDRERAVITKIYYMGFKWEEIAEQLGIEQNEVRNIRDRAVRKITKLYNAQSGGESRED